MTRARRRHGVRSSRSASRNAGKSRSRSASRPDVHPGQPNTASLGLSDGPAPSFSLLDTEGTSDSKPRNGSKSSRFSTRSDSKASTTDYVFPPASINRWEFQTRTANELKRLAKTFRLGKTRRSLTRKARALKACGTRTRVMVCVDCGKSRPGSGVQCSPGHHCSLRICPICQRNESERCVAELRPLVSRFIDSSSRPEREGYSFRSGTLTAQYNPKDPKDVSVEALRERVLALQASITHAWRKQQRSGAEWTLHCPGAGLVYGIETGKSGNVHMHFVYFGPHIQKAEFEKTVREAYSDAGFSYIRKISGNTKHTTTKNRAQLERAVCEALRYTYKAPASLDENWFDGPRVVMQPELAARWEVATRGVQLHNRLGAFRHQSFNDDRQESTIDDGASTGTDRVTSDRSEPVCPHCGSSNGYTTKEVEHAHLGHAVSFARAARVWLVSRWAIPQASNQEHRHTAKVRRHGAEALGRAQAT